MAGRGTDIALDAEARALGGLHVIACLAAAPRRLERQLAGRCARQGDPGSFERWIALHGGPGSLSGASILCNALRYLVREAGAKRAPRLLHAWMLAQQRAEERRGARRRRQVLLQDREWVRCCSFTLAVE
jgi:preprotein translocase subunit SecA